MPNTLSSHGRTTLAVATALLIGAPALAQQQSVTYRLNFFHPSATAAEARVAADALESLVGERTRPQKQIGLYPDAPPVVPGSPSYRTVQIGPMTQQLLQCPGAYALLVSAKDSGANPIGGSGERYTGCVFVSKAGIRSSVVVERYTRSSGSLLGGLVGGIRNAIQGDDAEWGDKTMARFIELYQQRAPGALVELIETPKGQQTPDAEKVTSLLQQAQASQVAATAATPAPAPSQAATSAAAVASHPMAEVIEARKNLTAMGMVYHSVDALQDALLRKDQLAVELFVKAGGVRADARGKTGQTSAEVAESQGDPVLKDLVRALR